MPPFYLLLDRRQALSATTLQRSKTETLLPGCQFKAAFRVQPRVELGWLHLCDGPCGISTLIDEAGSAVVCENYGGLSTMAPAATRSGFAKSEVEVHLSLSK